MKKIFALALCLIGAYAVAQDDGLSRLASRVELLLREKGHTLTGSERLEVRNKLTDVLNILRDNPSQPPRRGYKDTTEVGPLSRRSGGSMVYAELMVPVELNTLQVMANGGRVRVHSAQIVTENNMVYRLSDLENSGSLGDRQGMDVSLSQVYRMRVKELRLVLEAYANETTLLITATSDDRSLDFNDGRNAPPSPQPPTPGLENSYCVAACTDSSGNPDFRYSRGAMARTRLESEQMAREKLRAQYNCANDVTIASCDEVSRFDMFAAIASCSDVYGNADLRFTASAEGTSLEESKQLSREALIRQYTCSRGVTIYKAQRSENSSFYCVAGCTTDRGDVDPRYTRGESARSEVLAISTAIESVRRSYTCSNGISVETCSRR